MIECLEKLINYTMKHIQAFNEKFAEVFVVDSKTKKIKPSTRSSYTYWYGEKKGEIDMEISINTEDENQEQLAEKIYNGLKSQNLSESVKKIYIEFKDI
jgi:hypothetical protein